MRSSGAKPSRAREGFDFADEILTYLRASLTIKVWDTVLTAMIKVGTSGFSYPEWRGPFYPEKHPQQQMLEFYAKHFSAVEINST